MSRDSKLYLEDIAEAMTKIQRCLWGNETPVQGCSVRA
jgi:hypothetical protein